VPLAPEHLTEDLRRGSSPLALPRRPFVLLASPAQPPDPTFCYANLAGQRCSLQWAEFSGLPSATRRPPRPGGARPTVEQVDAHGYIDDYRGLRIASRARSSGSSAPRYGTWVDGGGGRLHGQAAAFTPPDPPPSPAPTDSP